MSQVQTLAELASIEDNDEFRRYSSRTISSIVDTVNGNLEFDKNFKSQTVEVTFAAANTDTEIMHGLNRTTVHYLIVNKDVACDVYNGNRANVLSACYLRCTVATTLTLILF